MENKNSNKAIPDNDAQKKLVEESNDNKIDQDFKGFPAGVVKENIINPKTDDEKKTADMDHTDGEKMNEEQIRQNLIMSINYLVSLLKKGWNNVGSLTIRSTMGKPVKVY